MKAAFGEEVIRLRCRLFENYTVGIGILAGSLRRKLNVQTVRLLPELEFCVRAEQGHRLNSLSPNRCSQGLDKRRCTRRPAEFNRIQVAAFSGEAEVFRGVGGGVGVVE